MVAAAAGSCPPPSTHGPTHFQRMYRGGFILAFLWKALSIWRNPNRSFQCEETLLYWMDFCFDLSEKFPDASCLLQGILPLPLCVFCVHARRSQETLNSGYHAELWMLQRLEHSCDLSQTAWGGGGGEGREERIAQWISGSQHYLGSVLVR